MVNSCEVLQKDCTNDWDFTAQPGFTMAKEAPFQLSYDNIQPRGYNYDVCIKCGNGQMATTSSFNIQQEDKCLPSYKGLSKVPFTLTEEQKALPEEE